MNGCTLESKSGVALHFALKSYIIIKISPKFAPFQHQHLSQGDNSNNHENKTLINFLYASLADNVQCYAPLHSACGGHMLKHEIRCSQHLRFEAMRRDSLLSPSYVTTSKNA